MRQGFSFRLIVLLVITYFCATSCGRSYQHSFRYKNLDCIEYAQALVHEDGHIGGVLFVPDDPVKKTMIGFINSEKNKISGAFFHLSDTDIVEALVQAHKRGVIIEIAIDHSAVGALRKKLESFDALDALTIFVYHVKYSILHHKFFVFENNLHNRSLLWNGSANATTFGTTKNQENVVVIDDSSTIGRYRDHFETLKQRCIH